MSNYPQNMAETKGTSCVSQSSDDAGNKEPEVITLLTPLLVPAKVKLSVLSAYPIHVYYPKDTQSPPLQIQSSAPVVFGNGDAAVYLVPDAPLGLEFVAGWTKLPDELKVLILAQNLVFDESVRFRNWKEITERVLFPHLRMTPEIANLAREVFYTQNEFQLFRGGDRVIHIHQGIMWRRFLKPPNRDMVRHVKVPIMLYQDDLGAISATSKTIPGFSSVKHLRLVLYLHVPWKGNNWEGLLKNEMAPTLAFDVPGCLEVYPHPGERPPPDWVLNQIQDDLRKRITFSEPLKELRDA
jgi:hypothetical protein